MNFHYTEKFYSVQGEGRYMGVPSVFLRMFGCNFRCKGFGRDSVDPTETHNPEVVEIIKNIDNYKTFKELPLVSTGCDTYSSIYPEFKRFVIKESAGELAEGIVKLLPYNKWEDEHLVITGGEPLLGWQKGYPDLLDDNNMQDLKELTFETNGTQKLTSELAFYLTNWALNASRKNSRREVTFSVSPKLSCSGESRADAIKPEIVCEYQEVGYVYLKFVVSTENDAEEALETVDVYRSAGFKGSVYLMPVGGVENVYKLNNRNVAELALKMGLRYSDRLHVPIWKNAWGT